MSRTLTGKLGRLAAAAVVFLACLAATSKSATEPASVTHADPGVAQKTQVYVCDFELTAPAVPASGEADKTQANLVYADRDATTVQARRTIDFFANTLVRLLQKEGYTARRQTGSLPATGVLLRGVFTEPDAKNRIRRAILGGGSTGAQFTLYVGTFNLAKPDQPLYQEAPVQSPDPRYGPMITLNAYIPLVKYNVDKNPSEEDVRKICHQIVSQLTSLISKNELAMSD